MIVITHKQIPEKIKCKADCIFRDKKESVCNFNTQLIPITINEKGKCMMFVKRK